MIGRYDKYELNTRPIETTRRTRGEVKVHEDSTRSITVQRKASWVCANIVERADSALSVDKDARKTRAPL